MTWILNTLNTYRIYDLRMYMNWHVMSLRKFINCMESFII